MLTTMQIDTVFRYVFLHFLFGLLDKNSQELQTVKQPINPFFVL